MNLMVSIGVSLVVASVTRLASFCTLSIFSRFVCAIVMKPRGSANPHKMACKGSANPSKSAPKGSAGPLKTAASKDGSSSSRLSPTKVKVEGILEDVEGFSYPRRCAPSSRPQVSPKHVASDRLKKAEQNLVLSNQFSVLSDDEMDFSSISSD